MSSTTLRTAAALVAILAGTNACSATAPGDVDTAAKLIQACKGPVSSYTAVDGTASGGKTTLDAPRRQALRGQLSRVAACGGSYKVVVFSSSSAASPTLAEGSIPLAGATDVSKARRLGAAVDDVLAQVDTHLARVIPTLDPRGSDIVAQFRLFAEWSRQAGSKGEPRMLLLTDGFQNIGVRTEQIVADPAAAASLFPVPNLPGAAVTVAGVGEVAGPAPATTVVDGLKAFYEHLCSRTGAASCTVVSETSKASS
ncbi:hypothetical protein [Tsukamurella tyrosinosolvens]|uniref:hypothetical protein n=1 Tax=Tsukamurella tyrosinosolvens TaxID=57704 RepID=UPI000798D37E|nr:hypothetical protein [Tsukamurella tyrosinosolvens]KXP06892.1 hypothetical protein AXK59_01900 [Tsukamurella tyrosinosolvens]